jgi:hypothetical protein
MPMVNPCSMPACSVLTMGRYCIEHDHQQHRRRRWAGIAIVTLLAGTIGGVVLRS